MNRLQLPKVSLEHPMLKVDLLCYTGLDSSMGETAIYISRFGVNWETVKYLPHSQTEDRLLFYFDNVLFDQEGGIYTGRIVYNGLDLGCVQFEYVKEKPTLVASAV